MNAVTETERPNEPVSEDTDSPEKNAEAASRLNEIIEDLESRLNGKELVKLLRYELQEILAHRLDPKDANVIQEDDFKTILYSNDLKKREIARIVGGIVLRARKLLDASEKRAREVKTKALQDMRRR